MTLVRPLAWLAAAASSVVRGVLLLWGSLAVYYSNLPWPAARLVLGIVFFAFGIWALWIAPRRRGWTTFAVAYALLLAWWWAIPARQDRDWRPEVAVLPRAEVVGDRLRIYNYRNFDYRSRDDFTPRYETRDYRLSHLTGVDFYVSYWAEGPVGHTFLSFIFDNAEPLSVSIETRPELGEGFDPLASMFKQFELIYVVGDERDIVRVRTDYRRESVYLYRLNISPESARALLMIYIGRINELAAEPEFYHLLSNSCTINIIRYANMAGRTGRLELAHVLNGWIDTYLYRSGRIDTTLPFDELRRRSHINAAAMAAGNMPDFWKRIRADLPTIGQ